MAFYLSSLEVLARLHRGKQVEQWLSYHQEAAYGVIRWLSLYRDKAHTYTVLYVESFDDGDEHDHNVHEFSTVDPDEFGVAHSFHSAEEAVAYACTYDGASADKFVTAGMINEEYAQQQKSRQQ
ncbi:hypothetical protein [Hymenobacter sp. GOD-10R]|uniref:hypothetical protein n=1 Tax=Hymenobacter sp. GOD-10R TaxID=3093922 RepID=UPI002D7809A1|nr:hypothetical protein [Hymenobacter sp. GOD-10R]WRQ31688.1 hypothetical protein SD425_28670 [Hymenobacter sp. GOD-10R]